MSRIGSSNLTASTRESATSEPRVLAEQPIPQGPATLPRWGAGDRRSTPGRAPRPSGIVEQRSGIGDRPLRPLGNAAVASGIVHPQRGALERSSSRTMPAFPSMNAGPSGGASTEDRLPAGPIGVSAVSTSRGTDAAQLDDLNDRLGRVTLGDAGPSRGPDAAELSAEDLSQIQELDELRAFGEQLESMGERDAFTGLESLIQELIDKLGVRREAPGAQEKRALIELRGNLPPETLAMIDHFAISRAEQEMRRRERGLKDKEHMAQFAGEMKALEGGWSAMNSAARADAVAARINARLRDIGVPALRVTTAPLGSLECGRFSFANWSMVLNEQMLAAPQLTMSHSVELTNTVYHEARHAEQWYLIARVRAEDGVPPDEVSKETRIPRAICEAAASEPALSDAQADMATRCYDSVYGKHKDHRDKVMSDGKRFSRQMPEAERLYRASMADPGVSPEEKREKTQSLLRLRELERENHQAYQELPEEQDAFEVGDAAGEAYRRAR